MIDLPWTFNIWCNVGYCGSYYVIGAAYMTRDSPLSALEVIYDYVSANHADKSKCIFAGDFNLPNIDWDNLEVGTTNS